MRRGPASFYRDYLRRGHGLLAAFARRAWSGLAAFARRWWAAIVREYRGIAPGDIGRGLRREVLRSPRLGRAALAFVLVAWSGFVAWNRLLVPLAQTPLPRPEPRFQVVAFFENGTGDGFPDSFPTLTETAALYDVVSPFWHSIDATGAVSADGYRQEVMDFCRAHRLQVVPLVGNVKSAAGNAFEAISTPESRARTVDNLAALAAQRGYDGLNLSFELLPAEARDSYTTFVRSLADVLHGQSRTLTVSVFPDVETSPEISGFFDYRSIGQAADCVVLLAYDRHWTATGPGPVAPEPWVETSLRSLLDYVPAGKVLLGIGTHAYDWPTTAVGGIAEYLSTRSALRRARDYGVAVGFDPASRQSFFSYAAGDGATREVWIEDAAHIVDKVNLAKAQQLGGVAVWRLGFSEDGALEQLGGAVGRGAGP